MALQGQTVIAASGDSGSEDCTRGPTALAVDDPGSQPDVVSAGGTTMSSGSASSQVVWNDCRVLCHGVTGRGRRRLLARCGRQPRATAPVGFSGGGHQSVRTTPPGAEPCPTSRTRPTRGTGRWPPTSTAPGAGSAAPAWPRRPTPGSSPTPTRAASTASAGSGPRSTRRTPSANFTDITTGNNDFTDTNGGDFAAGPGFDAASGLGTPVDQNLALALQGADGCPSVASVSPNTGRSRGGGAITISGGGFANATRSPSARPAPARSSPSPRTPSPSSRPTPRAQCVDVTVAELAGHLGHLGGRPLRLRRRPQLRPGLPLRGLRRRHLRLRRRRLLGQHGQPRT